MSTSALPLRRDHPIGSSNHGIMQSSSSSSRRSRNPISYRASSSSRNNGNEDLSEHLMMYERLIDDGVGLRPDRRRGDPRAWSRYLVDDSPDDTNTKNNCSRSDSANGKSGNRSIGRSHRLFPPPPPVPPSRQCDRKLVASVARCSHHEKSGSGYYYGYCPPPPPPSPFSEHKGEIRGVVRQHGDEKGSLPRCNNRSKSLGSRTHHHHDNNSSSFSEHGSRRENGSPRRSNIRSTSLGRGSYHFQQHNNSYSVLHPPRSPHVESEYGSPRSEHICSNGGYTKGHSPRGNDELLHTSSSRTNYQNMPPLPFREGESYNGISAQRERRNNDDDGLNSLDIRTMYDANEKHIVGDEETPSQEDIRRRLHRRSNDGYSRRGTRNHSLDRRATHRNEHGRQSSTPVMAPPPPTNPDFRKYLIHTHDDSDIQDPEDKRYSSRGRSLPKRRSKSSSSSSSRLRRTRSLMSTEKGDEPSISASIIGTTLLIPDKRHNKRTTTSIQRSLSNFSTTTK
mmetsp:Transcript_43659/g.91848  ORF Transcript_43659/g.91848 Transcript_43659/m.91848 type:complete len:508 (-) Transcript_43659:1648-3171(-)